MSSVRNNLGVEVGITREGWREEKQEKMRPASYQIEKQ